MLIKNEASLPYSLDAILAEIDNFSVESVEGTVTTTPPSGRIRTAKVTSQYKLLNIKDFFVSIIDKLSDAMEIESYTLRLDGGIQEISLLSKMILINGDEYRKAFYILNSTDRTRALRFNIGLYRADGLRLVLPVPDAITMERFVHKGRNFEAKVETIFNFVKSFPIVAARQVEMLESLGNQKVSIRKMLKKMLFENATSDVVVGASKNRATAFSKQLRVHPTDKINIVEYGIDISDMTLLAKPEDFLLKSSADFMVNAYQALQCYHSIYQGRDVGIISRESERFMNYLLMCGTLPDDKGSLTKGLVKEKPVRLKLKQVEMSV